MPTLCDLPTEILLKILDVLESADIDALFGVPELQEWLKDVVCVITDDPDHTHHTNIPTVISLDDVSRSLAMDNSRSITPDSLKNHYEVAILELHPPVLESGALDQILLLVNSIKNHVGLYPVNWTQSEISQRAPERMQNVSFRGLYYPEELWGKRTRTISFNVTYFHFQTTRLSPAVHRLPIIKNLTIVDTTVLPDKHGARIEMPELETLRVDQTPIDELLGVMNQQNLHNLRSLTIGYGPETSIDYTLIPTSSLTYLSIALPIEKFSGLSCPNLEKLLLSSTSLSCVGDLFVPKLKELILNVSGNIALYNIQADSMSSLVLSANSSITRLHNIHTPKLTSVSLLLSNNPVIPIEGEKFDFSFLYPVEKLNVYDEYGFLDTLWDMNGDGTHIVQVPNLKELVWLIKSLV